MEKDMDRLMMMVRQIFLRRENVMVFLLQNIEIYYNQSQKQELRQDILAHMT